MAEKAQGVEDIVAAVEAHRAWMLEHDELSVRRRRRAAGEIEELAVRRLRERWERPNAEVKLDDLAEAVARGVLDPYAAAQAVAG